MANSGTLHGRHSRLYLGVSGDAQPLKKLSSNGSTVSQWDINLGVDFQEDTGQGDTNKTKVPGLGDFGGSVQMFMQDDDDGSHIQHELIDAARNGTPVKFYGYPGAGAEVVNTYFWGTIFLSLTSLPANVANLVTLSFDMQAQSDIKYEHP